VGTGHFINIWEDNWLPLQDGYKVWSPKPLNTELSRVSQLIHHDLGIWNAPLINANFLPFEAMQILQLPLPTTTHMDSHYKGILEIMKTTPFTLHDMSSPHTLRVPDKLKTLDQKSYVTIRLKRKN